MKLPVAPPLPPMEATLVDEIPEGEGWQYEPKWDGFRCLVFRDGDEVYLQSKAGQPLARYFPEVVAAVQALPARRFLLDGELVIPMGHGRAEALSFDALLQRIHPAKSRIEKLSQETPARLVAFDLLVDERGKSLLERPLALRRAALEAFAVRAFTSAGAETFRLSPATLELKTVRRWFARVGGALDGVVAKRLDAPYASGERSAMQKIKQARTADCVVGGFRWAQAGAKGAGAKGAGGRLIGSLLLGLYDDEGKLDHVGFTAALKGPLRKELTERLLALRGGSGFTGRAPGGPSRWSTERSTQWEPVRPELVVEVSYDHVTNGRFRHGTGFVRLRPDKAARQCTMAQIASPGAAPFWLTEVPKPKSAAPRRERRRAS